MSIKGKGILLLLLAFVVFLSGCFKQPAPSEQMYTVLEKVVKAEKGFEEQQNPLVEAESKEEGIYNQIISLGMKQYDQIVKLSDEALKLIAKRKSLMEKETESMKASEEQFKAVKEIAKGLEDEKLKGQANELYAIMEKRYRSHDELYKSYKQGLQYDEKLYNLMKDKNVSLDELEQQINLLNDSYKQILSRNNTFNDLTKQYNSKKMEFYQTAGLKTSETKAKVKTS